MAMPGLNFAGGLSPAGQSLGLAGIPGLGTALQGQTADETEELRRKRMLEMQQRALLGTGGSAAGTALGLGGSVFGLGGTHPHCRP
jgi:hypothetical protein